MGKNNSPNLKDTYEQLRDLQKYLNTLDPDNIPTSLLDFYHKLVSAANRVNSKLRSKATKAIGVKSAFDPCVHLS